VNGPPVVRECLRGASDSDLERLTGLNVLSEPEDAADFDTGVSIGGKKEGASGL
jgi:hypothetical protein